MDQEQQQLICTSCGQNFKTTAQLKIHINSKCGTEKPFECNICYKRYISTSTLNAHKLIHKNEKPNLCNFCAATFLSKGQLKVHLRKHTNEKPFKCNECPKSFAHRESLITHSSVHSNVRPYYCVCCASTFSCIGNWMKHRKSRPTTCGLEKYAKINKIAARPSSKDLSENKRSAHQFFDLNRFDMQEDDDLKNEKDLGKIEIDQNNHNQEQVNNSSLNMVNIPIEVQNYHIDTAVLARIPNSIQIAVQIIPENICQHIDTFNSVDDMFFQREEIVKCDKIAEEFEANYDDNDDDEDSSKTSDEEPISPESSLNELQAVRKLQTFECLHCPKQFQYLTLMSKHLKVFHDINMPENNYKALLNGEEIIVTCHNRKLKTLKCQYCPKTYSNPACKVKHEMVHGENGKLIHKCPVCPHYFETEHLAVEHSQEKHRDKLMCNMCDKMFKKLDNLQMHKKYKHSEKPIKKEIFICPKCARTFSAKSTLTDHERSNCGKRGLYKCPECNKYFYSAGSLKSHRSVHTGEMKFGCNHCSKRFRTKGQVKVHERMHNGEKPFKCEHCPKEFSHRETLLTHTSLHTGYKRFMCSGCNQRFSCISNLQAHRKAYKNTCGQMPNNTKVIGHMSTTQKNI